MPSSTGTDVSLVAFGAHPDDIEFGCGGVIAKATRAGHTAHFVVCSQGEAGSFGTPQERTAESRRGADEILRATNEFVELDGDAHLELRTAHAIQLAGILRRVRPTIVLAPTLVENQHPDHARLGRLVRDAMRLARYGGVKELRGQATHVCQVLLYYAVSPDSEPHDITPVLFDVSAPEDIAEWTAAMNAHGTQTRARSYVDMQLARARVNGLRAGVASAIALYPNDPLVFDSLAKLEGSASRF